MASDLEQVAFLEKYVFAEDRKAVVDLLTDTADKLALTGLQAVLEGDLQSAEKTVEELKQQGYEHTSCKFSSREEIRTLLNLKKWDAGEKGRMELQEFLCEVLNVNLMAPPNVIQSGGHTGQQVVSEPLPNALPEQRYTWDACFTALFGPQRYHFEAEAYPLVFAHPSTTDDVKQDILQDCGTPATLPDVERYIAQWLRSEEALRSMGLHSTSTNWLLENVNKLTAQQLHHLLPSVKNSCKATRVLIGALVTKLEGYDSDAQVESAPYTKAMAFLRKAMELCQQLGTSANWLRVRVLWGVVRLGVANDALDLAALKTFLQDGGSLSWSYSSAPAGDDEHVHTGITCDMCGTNPIKGTRHKSTSRSDYDLCSNCVATTAASAFGPFHTITEGNTIFLYADDPHLNGLLLRPSSSYHSLRQEVHKIVVDAVYWDGRTQNGIVCDVCSRVNFRGSRYKSVHTHNWDCCATCRGTPAAAPYEPFEEVAGADRLLSVVENSPLHPHMDLLLHRQAVAEGLLLSGLADNQPAINMLRESGGDVHGLNQRVEMDWLPSNSKEYGVQEPIHLQVAVKGVESVAVNIYEINQWAYYSAEMREVGGDLQLAGLGATLSSSTSYPAAAFTRSILEVKCLEGRRGTFVVELLAGGGGGLTRRAIIHKGSIRAVERLGIAGNGFSLYYEDWTPVTAPKIFMGGRTYTPNGEDETEILIPYAPVGRSGVKQVVLGGGQGEGTLHSFQHREESYRCEVDWYLEREALVPQGTVALVVRVSLTLHGEPCPLSLLDKVKLSITAEDREGATMSQVVDSFHLDDDISGGVHHLRVPPWCRSISSQLTAQIQLAAPGANGQPALQEFSSEHSVTAYSDPGDQQPIWDVFLQALPVGGWGLRVLGRCGEPPPQGTGNELSVEVSLRHRLMKEGMWTTFSALGPGADGIIQLGGLQGILEVQAKLSGNGGLVTVTRKWSMGTSGESAVACPTDHSGVNLLVSTPGQPLYVPTAWKLTPAPKVSLFELQQGGKQSPWRAPNNLVARLEGWVAAVPGYLVVNPQRAGSFLLYAPGSCMPLCKIYVADPDPRPAAIATVGDRGLLLTGTTIITPPPPHPLQLLSSQCTATDGISLQLSGSEAELSTVAVVVSLQRYLHPQGFETGLEPSTPDMESPFQELPPQESQYLPGVHLDPAITYAMQRRHILSHQSPRPGILLTPPSLLTRPVRTRDISTRPVHMPAPPKPSPSMYESQAAPCSYARSSACLNSSVDRLRGGGPWLGGLGGGGDGGGCSPALGFCPAAVVVGPLACDEEGRVVVSKAELEERWGVKIGESGHTVMRVVAVAADSGNCATAMVPVTGMAPPRSAPLREQKGAVPTSLVMESRSIEALQPGRVLKVADAASAKFSVLGSMEEAWVLLGTMLSLRGGRHVSGKSHHAAWQEWSFLRNWHTLSSSEKLKLLGKYASHELHMYLLYQDPPFFKAHVLPMLQAKLQEERQVMDWLLLGVPGVWEHWSAPHRWSTLTPVEKCMVAAAKGGEAAQRLAEDMRSRVRPAKDNPDAAARYRELWQQGFNALLTAGALDPPTHTPAPTAPQDTPPDDDMSDASDDDDDDSSAPDDDGWDLVEETETEEFEAGGLFSRKEGAPAPSMAMFGAPPPPAPTSRKLAAAAPPPQSGLAFGAAAMLAPVAKAKKSSFASDLKQRERVVADSAKLFTPNLVTQEWGESGYWEVSPRRVGTSRSSRGLSPVDGSALVEESEYWADWAEWLGKQGRQAHGVPGDFLSEHLLMAGGSFTSAVMAFAVIGLPWAAAAQGVDVTSVGGGLELQARSPALVALKESRPGTPPPAGRSVVAVTQYLFDPLIPHVEDPETGEKVRRVEEGPLLAGRRYGLTAVITSTALSPITLDILSQVPEGALPLMSHPSPHSQTITLNPYGSTHLQLVFYFPLPGTFSQVPLSVSSKGRLLWAPQAPLPPLQVLTSLPPRPEPRAAFEWWKFATTASDDQVLEYLRTGDLTRANVDDVADRCWRRSFFYAATAALRGRNVWCEKIWRFAVVYMDEQCLKELLPSTPLPSRLGPLASTPLLEVSPWEKSYRHFEYWPVINRFAHPLPNAMGGGGAGQSGGLLQENAAVRAQWSELLTVMARINGVRPREALQAACHLALQGRVEDATSLVSRHLSTPAQLSALDAGGQLQFEYLTAWLELAGPSQEVEHAKRVAAKYKGNNDPVWGPKFRELASTLRDISGEVAAVGGEEGEEGDVVQEPVLTIKHPPGADGKMVLHHHNLEEIKVEAYEMDVELLFTLQPFELLAASGGAGGRGGNRTGGARLAQVSYVRPRQVQKVPLPPGPAEISLNLDTLFPTLTSSSVVVEMSGGGLSRTCLRYASGMEVHVMEAQGLLQVVASATRLPVPAAYVKVFGEGKDGGRSWFHKDGYTDRRGKFDFAKVVGAGVEGEQKPARFAILVLHEAGGGAVITEANARQ